jgi:hypothetical protein
LEPLDDVLLKFGELAATVGPHAIGRWFQRGSGGTDEALLADFRMMVASAEAALTMDALRLPGTAGTWAGFPFVWESDVVLALRTFLPDD